MRRYFAIITGTALFALVMAWTVRGEWANAAGLQSASLLNTWVFQEDREHFGGLSAIEMLDSDHALALTDRARLFHLTLSRDGMDQIVDVVVQPVARLAAGPDRGDGGRYGFDAEGLSLMPSGRLAVSFENRQRVALYPMPDLDGTPPRFSKPLRMLFHPGWPGMHINKSLEAVAVDAHGRIHTLPEGGRIDGAIPIYRWKGGDWQIVASLPVSGRFSPVAADFGPDGRLYVLERSFALFGFRTQLRSMVLSEDGAEDLVVHFRSLIGTHDNLEGVDVWRDQAGLLRATMVGDDNFTSLLRSELVEYRLAD